MTSVPSFKIASAFVIALRCVAGLHSTASLSRADPEGIFYTRMVPNSIDSIQPIGHGHPIVGTNGDKFWLVAGTHDGGPFANEYSPPSYKNITRSAMCDVRNMHEEVGALQCIHWQVEDAYDAPWFHVCFPEGEDDVRWVDSNADSMRETATRLAAEASSPRGQQQTLGLAQQTGGLEAGGENRKAIATLTHRPGHFGKQLWSGTCRGSYVRLNMLDLVDSKGLEVLYQGGPDFPDACMGDVMAAVQQLGLESWPLRRCNVDRGRKIQDFPWPVRS